MMQSELTVRHRHHNIIVNEKTLYCYIAKNACTTFKQQTLKTHHATEGADLEPHRGVHRAIQRYSLKNYEVDLTEMSGFVIVREPRERLVSSFLEKFVRVEVVPDFASAVFQSPNEIESRTFYEFIRAITQASPASLNEHWARQNEHLIPGIRYDLIDFASISCSEALRELGYDTKKFARTPKSYGRLIPGCERKSIRELREIYATEGILPSVGSFYGQDVCAMVIDYFADDLELYERAKRAGAMAD